MEAVFRAAGGPLAAIIVPCWRGQRANGDGSLPTQVAKREQGAQKIHVFFLRYLVRNVPRMLLCYLCVMDNTTGYAVYQTHTPPEYSLGCGYNCFVDPTF